MVSRRKRETPGSVTCLICIPAWYFLSFSSGCALSTEVEAKAWCTGELEVQEDVSVRCCLISLPKKFSHWVVKGRRLCLLLTVVVVRQLKFVLVLYCSRVSSL